MWQGQKIGVQNAEATDINVCIILHISPQNYVLFLEIELFLSYNFGCKTFGKGVL